MASPPEITCKNLTGKFVMNKTLSDDPDPVLALQGISWLIRKAIGLATVLTIKEYAEDGVVRIDITSVAAGVTSTQENRVLDWSERDHTDRVFGKLRGRSRFWTTGGFERAGPGDDDDNAFLRGEKLKDLATETRFLDDEHVQSYVVSVDGGDWTGEQCWGFEEIDGKRYHTRRVVVRKGDGVQRARLVYDYQGSGEENDLAYGE